MFRFLTTILLACSIASTTFSCQETTLESKSSKPETPVANPVGVIDAKPASGRYVALPDGKYMVPYTAKIPNTEITFEMVPIPGGTFQMGRNDRKHPDQGPTFSVSVEPFWMGKHEVTWAEFEEFMKMEWVFKKLQAKGVRIINEKTAIDAVTAPSELYDPYISYEYGDLPSQPASTMTQYSAKQYTKWLSLSSNSFYRLPFESEWEYACRAGTTTRYYFGDDAADLKDHAWFDDNSDEQRHSVGKLKPNPWGLHDMLGNVCEWTLDQYDPKGYRHIDASKSGQTSTSEEAFNKPDKEYPRCLRGGSWEMLADECTSTSRLGSNEDWKDQDPNIPRSPWWFTSELGLSAGFRVIRPLNVPDRKLQESYWNADCNSIKRAVSFNLELSGRSAKGPVDENIADDINAHFKPKELKARPNDYYFRNR